MKKSVDIPAILNSHINRGDAHINRMSLYLQEFNRRHSNLDKIFADLFHPDWAFLENITRRLFSIQKILTYNVFPLILQLLEEDVYQTTYIDRANKLEKLLVIDDANVWIEMQELPRNIDIYDVMTGEISEESLNKILKGAEELPNLWEELKIKTEAVCKKAPRPHQSIVFINLD